MPKKCPKNKKLKFGLCMNKKGNSSNSKNKGMKIFLGIVLALIFFGLFNLGVSTFYPSPDYSDYCSFPNADKMDIGADYTQCSAEYEQDRADYSNKIFYIFVVSGLILAVAGLFISSLPFQILTLSSGTALIIEGILRNLGNRISSFIAGILVFGIISYFVWRKFK